MAVKFGADHVINTREQDLEQTLSELTGGTMCDVAFDLVGSADTINMLLKCIRPGGKVVALAYAEPNFFINCQELVIKEKEVLGIRGSTRQDLRDSIALVESGKLVPYVSKIYKLEEINDALDSLRACQSLGRSAILFD